MTSRKRVGIVGYGYVGRAMWNFFRLHYDVVVYDPAYPRDAETGLTREGAQWVDQAGINRCDLAVVCVPTPQSESGACNTSIVEHTVRWLETPLILLKSTVAIGTTDRLRAETGKRIVFSPEYCGESSYWTPYRFHTEVKETPFFTFGGAPEDTSVCVDFFLKVAGPVKTYRQTSAKAAEMAKYMENTFYAAKITFCYEMATLCANAGIDFNEVRELWLLDPRINPMHTAVFAENNKPFSGKCLPKDLAALIAFAEESGYAPEFLREVASSNERIGRIRSSQQASSSSTTG